MKLVPAHDKTSREVRKKDLWKVFHDSNDMYNALFRTHGVHSGGIAIAHMQVNDEDPLRFFVARTKVCGYNIIINPKIVHHSSYQQTRHEGCLSFPNRKENAVLRWPKCKVEFYVFEDEYMSKEQIEKSLFPVIRKETATFSGIKAQVFQHEIAHMDGENIWLIETI